MNKYDTLHYFNVNQKLMSVLKQTNLVYIALDNIYINKVNIINFKVICFEISLVYFVMDFVFGEIK